MFHSAIDGKGKRNVTVNGIPIRNVIWANEKKGLLCFTPLPLRKNNRKGEFYTRLLRGKVVVSYANDPK